MNVKWHVLFTLLYLFLSTQSNAQYISVRGHFEVDQQLGCSDLTVAVTNISPGICASPPCPIAYKFEGRTSPETSDTFYTYTAPDTVWIYQFIQGPSGDREDSVQLIIVTPELPDVELFSCNNLELLVQVNDSYYDEYEINYGDGPIITVPKGNPILPYTYANNSQRTVSVTGLFTTATNRCGVTAILFDPTATVLPAQIDSLIQLNASTLKLDYNLPANSINTLEVSVGNNTSFVLFKNINQNTIIDTLINLNLSQNTYCFRMATYDACSNFKSYSNEVCTVNLNVSTQNNQITIDWSTFDFGAGQTTNLFRDGVLLQSLPMPTVQHIDTTVICNTTYCYQTEVSYNGSISRSLAVCETAFSTDIPPAINNISSITNSDSIEWTWQIPPNTAPASYVVHRTLEDGSMIENNSVSTNIFKESFENTVKFISVQIVDICDNMSPLNLIGSSLLLKGTIDGALDTQLSWNNYFGWANGFQGYYITLKDKDGVRIDSIYTGGDTSYTMLLADQVEQTITFTVWAIPVTNGVAYSRSNILTFERDPIIAIPNSFTPNGDGLNDKFVISGKFIKSYEMQIFNRWGEALFQTTDLENGWDGTSKNKKIATGNYAYWIRVKDLNGNEHIRTGSILILSN